MKTIIIASFHVLVSRNILSTPVISHLTAKNIRVVILVPEHKKEYFEKNFGAPNVFIEPIRAYVFSKGFLGLIFKRLSRPMLDTPTTRIRMLQKLVVDRKPFYYYGFIVPARIIGRFRLVVSFVRFLDYFFRAKKGYFYPVFEKYKPDLIISTD